MGVKSVGSTHKLLSKLFFLSGVEVGGIPGVAVDVYKRQAYLAKFAGAEAISFTAQYAGQTQGVVPVSYTHLDVYKRQR